MWKKLLIIVPSCRNTHSELFKNKKGLAIADPFFRILLKLKSCTLIDARRSDKRKSGEVIDGREFVLGKSREVIDGRQSVHGSSRELFVGRRLLLYKSSSTRLRASMATLFFWCNRRLATLTTPVPKSYRRRPTIRTPRLGSCHRSAWMKESKSWSYPP